ncbi:MAG: histidine phosphatase family protein [Solirubrobacteraceae bacterium]
MPRDFQRPFVLPLGATEVVLIRHGSARHSTPEAPLDLVDGHSDPELTELGQRQAVAVAQRLAESPIAAVFVTPLRRTQQTAAPLARRLARDPVVMPQLREVYLGDWEGQLNQRVARDDSLTHRIFAAERWDVIPNAEPMEQFSKRISVGMERLSDAGGPDATVLAIVHGGVIAEACRQVTGSRAFAFLYAENGSLTRLMRLSSGRWALISFNDTSHLRERD